MGQEDATDIEYAVEYDGNEPTDVEEDLEGDAAEIQKPWNPEDIRVNTKQFSLRHVLDMIDDKDLDLAPDFQRHKVWKPTQKSRLVESILLQIPIGAFYWAEDPDGMIRVIDGLQRLSTVHDYVRGGMGSTNGFPLVNLEYLVDVEGRRYTELAPAWQRRISNTQIVAHVVDPSTPDGVKYDIFKRVNTGGTPLSAQEIRHCMSKARSRDFLKRCAAFSDFRAATGGRLQEHPRMVDRELVLRFCAFRLLGRTTAALDDPGQVSDAQLERLADALRGAYRVHGSMEVLLERTTAALDDPRQVPDAQLDRLADELRGAMRNGQLVFGEHAFRKWPRGATRRGPINRALFESWAVALADEDPTRLRQARTKLIGLTRAAMKDDVDYVNAISISTGDPTRVEKRFRTALQILREAQA
jgi:hypothetical protein